MKIFSDDTKRLTQLRELVNSHGEISVDEFGKSRFGQSAIDNTFIGDFDGDEKITESDYLICSNWLMQGKPQDIERYNRDRGIAPSAVKLPSSGLVPKGEYLPSSSRILDAKVQSDSVEERTDFNEDGVVDWDDLYILADFVLQGNPIRQEDYNVSRMTYPLTVRMPNLTTANFTCDGDECCDDDYDGSGTLTAVDALIYYAWSSLIDWEEKPGSTSDIDWYNQMAPEGFKFSPTKFPTMPCADFDQDGELTSRDALIYYGFTLVNWANSPDGMAMVTWYDTETAERLDGFGFAANSFPVCAIDSVTECMGIAEMCVGADATVNWADFLIFYKWISSGKCETVECYNALRGAYAEACKLPFEIYESIGSRIAQFEGVQTGEENL